VRLPGPRAKKLPLPDDLEGELVRYVIAHEVGHTLGLRHNHKASSSYTVAQLRDKAFTEKFGDEASIMDYGRFNYVAQPGDNARLIPMLGPYDNSVDGLLAGSFGENARSGARLPGYHCRPTGHESNPPFWRRGCCCAGRPDVQMEDRQNDPVAAGTYGFKNIERIVPMLIPATTNLVNRTIS